MKNTLTEYAQFLRRWPLWYILIFIFLLRPAIIKAQLIERDSGFVASQAIKEQAGFAIHRDNYFITGIPLNEQPTKNNSDVKYQISFEQRLRRTSLPGGLFPYLTYTQKAFWDVYRDSKPFDEINFNPGIAFVRPFFVKGHRLVYAALSLEHESNGRDSIYSRSWNFVAFSLRAQIQERWIAGLKFWLPMSYKDENPNLMEYIGFAEASVNYSIKPNKWSFDITAKKGKGWNKKGSMQAQLNWRPFKDENQHLMLQWFQGYGESLIDYQKHTSMIRLGFVLKSTALGFF
ncbi:phospholipase A [Olivibacter sp. XZL3]|uniref:phospholipase A n=1 Tax=Olivibacter sp. XZL3 TaxID=1735116 RepID=UPI0010647B59|nr:phospholipase A [Olivibacter sp. XZL3]